MTAEGYLTSTVSICARCRRPLPARIHIERGAVWLRKVCPDHGPQEARISSDAEAYLDTARFHRRASVPLEFSAAARGCPGSCGLCPEHEQHVCMPIVEITGRCDLSCPICLVPEGATDDLDLEQVEAILDRLIATEGRIDVLNLSGGEPLLHPRFLDIVDACARRDEIVRVSVSTNGLALLRAPAVLDRLAERNAVVSLQFDGRDDEACVRLRGRPLLEEKMRLIDLARERGVALSLTATVAAGVNERFLPGILDLLFAEDQIRSVMIQPAAYTGRAARRGRPRDATSIPDVLRAIDGAARGTVSAADFSPLPCSHPACFSLSYYLSVGEERFVAVKALAAIDRYLDLLANRAIVGTDAESFEAVRSAVYDLWSGPAALAPDSRGALTAIRRILDSISCCGPFRAREAMARAERSMKSVFIHSFMDADTFDLSRARKCCNVYPLADGRLVPACIRNCLGAGHA